MKAMLLAAGRGARMRPLTDHCPKPLLMAGKYSLIEHHLLALHAAGITDIIINLAYKAERICQQLGKGHQYGCNITYSNEGAQALETAGGIIHALPLLGEEPFLLISADIWTDYPYATLLRPHNKQIHLVLVNNPEHHPEGDFALQAEDAVLTTQGSRKLTYSGIGVYHPDIFRQLAPGIRPLRPVLMSAIQAGLVSGEHYHGNWIDIGTPARLEYLQNVLKQRHR